MADIGASGSLPLGILYAVMALCGVALRVPQVTVGADECPRGSLVEERGSGAALEKQLNAHAERCAAAGPHGPVADFPRAVRPCGVHRQVTVGVSARFAS